MNQPLGRCAGNAIEVSECWESLQGAGPDDLLELSLRLAAEALLLSRRSEPERLDQELEAARTVLRQHLQSGAAADKFAEMIAAQGGDPNAPLPLHPAVSVLAQQEGTIQAIDAEAIGLTLVTLGGGRRVMTDSIDHAVGIRMQVRIGDAVEVGQPLLQLHAPREQQESASQALQAAFKCTEHPCQSPPLVGERVGGRG